MEQVERKLTAILAADVAGYSRLMAADEGTLAALKSHRRDLIDPKIKEHRGPVVDAARCAADVQRANGPSQRGVRSRSAPPIACGH
jgi:class 3 adenylate cyclase